jgi:hypothetical protein
VPAGERAAVRRAYRCACDGESDRLPRIVATRGLASIAVRVLDEIESRGGAPTEGCPWSAWRDPVIALAQRVIPLLETGADVGDWPAVAVRAAEAMTSARLATEAADREADRREREARERAERAGREPRR